MYDQLFKTLFYTHLTMLVNIYVKVGNLSFHTNSDSTSIEAILLFCGALSFLIYTIFFMYLCLYFMNLLLINESNKSTMHQKFT